MTPCSVVVFAKAPVPGRVKTRMTPPLSPEQAAQLYAAMLGDVLEVTAEFAERRELDAVLLVDPAAACGDLARTAPPRFRISAQRGPDLSARMAWAIAEAAATGSRRVLVRGSDSPALESSTLDVALDALAECDLSVCPDLDGGYSLIALTRPVPGLFDHPMSTGRVLDDTLDNARRDGVRVRVLSPHFDLDTAEDLTHLARARSEGRAQGCRRTLAYLDEQALWPDG
jgi:rSAM/selenodomain-associated transferase 1